MLSWFRHGSHSKFGMRCLNAKSRFFSPNDSNLTAIGLGAWDRFYLYFVDGVQVGLGKFNRFDIRFNNVIFNVNIKSRSLIKELIDTYGKLTMWQGRCCVEVRP